MKYNGLFWGLLNIYLFFSAAASAQISHGGRPLAPQAPPVPPEVGEEATLKRRAADEYYAAATPPFGGWELRDARL